MLSKPYLVALVATFLLVPAAPALGEGSPTIAGAPVVPYGQQEFGNTTAGTPTNYSSCGYEFWTLPVSAGDAVTIDFDEINDYSESRTRVFSSGTNDYNLSDASPVAEQDAGDDGRGELTFTTTRTEHMPLQFSTCPAGPYDFTAFVKHAVRMAVLFSSRSALLGGVRVGVHTPDGGAVTDPSLFVALQIRGTVGPWITVGHSTPTNGIAGMLFSIPKTFSGRRVSMRAFATGGNYTSEATATKTVQLSRALILALPAFRSLARTGNVKVAVKLSNRGLITDRALKVDAEIYYGRGWHVVGTASVKGSVAKTYLLIPKRFKHTHVMFRVRARGDYPTQVTSGRRVLVK